MSKFNKPDQQVGCRAQGFRISTKLMVLLITTKSLYKQSRDKTTFRQKFEICSNFTREIPLKIKRNKKKSKVKFVLKLRLNILKFRVNFEKNHPSSVFLKIVENFFNLMKKLNPQEICSAQIYIYIYVYIYTPMSKACTILL